MLKTNIPQVKVGIVAVSRDCFPVTLSQQRFGELLASCRRKHIPVTAVNEIVEKEGDIPLVLNVIADKKINALVIFLGNFGPEVPITILCQKFSGPVMVCGASEESQENLFEGRGDAYCGLLSASYNLRMRNVTAYIPEVPIGSADEVAGMIDDFIPVARTLIGLKNLKIFTFGPRPQDFFTCEAPLKPLLDLGIEIMENSELDIYQVFKNTTNDQSVKAIMAEIRAETGNTNSNLIEKLARYEIALTRFYEENRGISEYVLFANKCWPAFEPFFGFVPCYINSRMNSKGIPVACEVDVYGGLSQYIAMAVSESPVTILDINNTVPSDMINKSKSILKKYKPDDLFMGFHCGNTPGVCLQTPEFRYHPLIHRLLENGKDPQITYGTLEGKLLPGKTTIVRLHPNSDGNLKAYVAEGEILDIDPHSFGGIGVFAVPEMKRFYRHVLLAKGFPHHTAVAFQHVGKYIFNVFKMLRIEDISFNFPSGVLYHGENPYK